jgi:hypothetical protein
MCFSATASFTMGSLLIVAGAASLKKAPAKRHFFFAGIPVIFGLQQVAEGFLWLSFTDSAYAAYQRHFTYTFLFFAQVIWPTWVPLSFFLMEEIEKRKRILRILMGMGVAVSLYLLFCLCYYPVSTIMQSHHIHYELDFPDYLKWITAPIYFLTTVLSPFISGWKGSKLIGVFLFASYLLSTFFFRDNLISVWCFLAAGVSILVYEEMRRVYRIR